jgi:hypothetical protein
MRERVRKARKLPAALHFCEGIFPFLRQKICISKIKNNIFEFRVYL